MFSLIGTNENLEVKFREKFQLHHLLHLNSFRNRNQS